MKSLQRRLSELSAAVEAATAKEEVVAILLVVVHSREELLALEAYRGEHPHPPRPSGKGRVRLTVEQIAAAELLRQYGVEPPQPTPRRRRQC